MTYALTFLIVQLMFLMIGIVGGIEFGTFNAGMLCFLSQAIGVITCIIEYIIRSFNKKKG